MSLWIWQVFGWIGDVVVLSLLWTVCSVPLITVGAASAALYDSVAACFVRQETDYLRLALLPLFALPAIVARIDAALLEPVFRRFEQAEE